MTLQNRVTPFSEIVATPDRGLFMGNRGVLHGEGRVLGRTRWRGRRWIVCSLVPRGAPRALMTPGRYTELFFLDEATALAAGHRPCAECRREAFRAFAAAWSEGTGGSERCSATEIDHVLHEARLDDGMQRTHEARLEDLPDGAMVARNGDAWLVARHRLWRWTPRGYDRALPMEGDEAVHVLTPKQTILALRKGYAAELHPSLGR